MYCTKCGKELPDDAAFCLRCGAPQKVGAAPAMTERWETCHVELEDMGTGIFRHPYRLCAYATGPKGRYRVRCSRKLVVPKADLAGIRSARTIAELSTSIQPDALVVRDEFIGELSRAGWEPVSPGPSWFGHRFRRRVKS